MLTEADVIWAPMATLDEVTIDPQARAAGCFVVTPDQWGGAFEGPATPIRFPGLEVGPRGPAPLLGQHTAEVLAEMGFERRQRLAAKVMDDTTFEREAGFIAAINHRAASTTRRTPSGG